MFFKWRSKEGWHLEAEKDGSGILIDPGRICLEKNVVRTQFADSIKIGCSSCVGH